MTINPVVVNDEETLDMIGEYAARLNITPDAWVAAAIRIGVEQQDTPKKFKNLALAFEIKDVISIKQHDPFFPTMDMFTAREQRDHRRLWIEHLENTEDTKRHGNLYLWENKGNYPIVIGTKLYLDSLSSDFKSSLPSEVETEERKMKALMPWGIWEWYGYHMLYEDLVLNAITAELPCQYLKQSHVHRLLTYWGATRHGTMGMFADILRKLENPTTPQVAEEMNNRMKVALEEGDDIIIVL